MKPAEEELIKSIQELKTSFWSSNLIENSLKRWAYSQQSFGLLSEEFINNPDLTNFIEKNIFTINATKNFFILWIHIENYFLLPKVNLTLVQEKLTQIETALVKCLEDESVTIESKERGTALLPQVLVNAKFIRRLYSANDENLSKIFLKYLPVPRKNIFHDQPIPEIIAERELVSSKIIKNLINQNANDLDYVENIVINLQRKFRAKKRAKENLKQLPYQYASFWRGPNLPRGFTIKEVKELIENANKPYIPKCNNELAIRILAATKKVSLFSTVRHLTSVTALESIFNDGLLGRRNLIQFYMPFTPATLWESDIQNGDSNVVCLGANIIDPQARHGIELVFDAKKISEGNPCIFYKQRDLGYDPNVIRNVKIGDLNLYFSHTSTYRCQPPNVSSFILFNKCGRQYAVSHVIKPLLIADNIEEMHQILSLNFFRFIDELRMQYYDDDTYDSNKIYSALSNLNDQQLVQTLLDIGKKMTDTMEFNFYGAYRINFSALINITNQWSSFTLNLSSFIKELKAGNINKLNEAKNKLPQIFNSYRFIDYLLLTTNDKQVVTTLQEQRKKCSLPTWVEPIAEHSSARASVVSK